MDKPLVFLDDSQRVEACDLDGLFAALSDPVEAAPISPAGGLRVWTMLGASAILLVLAAVVVTCWHS